MMCTAAVTAYWDSWRERRHHGCYSYFFFSCCIHVILSRAELQASRSRFGWNVHVILQDLIPSLRHRTFLTATYLQLGAKKYRSVNRSLVNGCSIKKPQSLAICIILLFLARPFCGHCWSAALHLCFSLNKSTSVINHTVTSTRWCVSLDRWHWQAP